MPIGSLKKDKIRNKDIDLLKSELQITRKQLLQAQKKYNKLYNCTSHCYFTIDQKANILSANYQSEALLGYAEHLLLGRPFYQFISIHSQEIFYKHLNSTFSLANKENCELELLKRGNKRLFVHIEMIYLIDHVVLISASDITHYKILETKSIELNKSLQLIEELFQSATDAIGVIDDNFHFIAINEAFKKTFSKIFFTKVAIKNNFLLILADFPDLKSKILSAHQQAINEKSACIIAENNSEKDEAYYCYEMHFKLLMNYQKKNHIILFIKNITEYKLYQRYQLKQQSILAHTSRMHAMGEMASALAHEINQPLAAINVYSHSCLLRYKDDHLINENLKSVLEKIASQAEHAGEIVHRMKNFMREGTQCLEKIDINTIIRQALIYLEYKRIELKFNIELKLTDNLPMISVDRMQIIQVIMNLAQNSIEAFKEAHLEELKIKIKTTLIDQYIEVDFLDNGPGIPDQIINKILNSYFTTKPHGTGLGLAICRTLIEAHGGKLFIKHPNKGGAWFCFALPIKEDFLV